MCCFGFLTLTGWRDKICQQLVYFPPRPMYEVDEEADVEMQTMYVLDEEGRRRDPLKLKCRKLTTRKISTL